MHSAVAAGWCSGGWATGRARGFQSSLAWALESFGHPCLGGEVRTVHKGSCRPSYPCLGEFDVAPGVRPWNWGASEWACGGLEKGQGAYSEDRGKKNSVQRELKTGLPFELTRTTSTSLRFRLGAHPKRKTEDEIHRCRLLAHPLRHHGHVAAGVHRWSWGKRISGGKVSRHGISLQHSVQGGSFGTATKTNSRLFQREKSAKKLTTCISRFTFLHMRLELKIEPKRACAHRSMVRYKRNVSTFFVPMFSWHGMVHYRRHQSGW